MLIYLSRHPFIKFSLALFAGLFAVPFLAFSAYDDVTLTTDVALSVGGVTLTVSGSSALVESITVNASNFTVDMLSGSTITVTSADSRDFSTSGAAGYNTSRTCGSSSSTIEITSSGNTTVTVTPEATTCSAAASTSSSSSGGGGGGGIVGIGTSSVAPRPATPTASTTVDTVTSSATPTTKAKPALIATIVSPVFNSSLSRGTSNADVKRLQQLLNSDPDTQVATSGDGSPGNETSYFGSLTEKAVQKFQIKHSIVSSGTPGTTGFGLLGPKTRAKLADVFEGMGVPATEVAKPSVVATKVSPVFNKTLRNGVLHTDVKRLQQLLNSDPDTQVATNGDGSPGNETNYFGSLTQKAVQKFQVKYSIVSSGTPGTTGFGLVGPKTRAKLVEVFGSE